MTDFSELKHIVNINSYTGNKHGVDQNGAIFCTWMGQIGYKKTTFSRELIGNHLLFESNSQIDSPKLLLLGHLDTVFPPSKFERFSEDRDWIYGPGVCDMKGGNIVALEALRNSYQHSGAINNIDMLLVSDEETGSDDSKHLTAELAQHYDLCLVFEAAGKNHEAVIARKGVGTFYIDLQGKAAHAGNDYSLGCNANLAAAHMVLALTTLTDLAQGTTVNAGKITGGIGANTISPEAQITVEIRYTQIKERDRLLTALDEIVANEFVAGVQATLSGGIQRDVMQPNAAQSAFVDQISNILGETLLTESRGGVSDANIVAATGVPTLDGFGPFGDGDHTIHERASKQSFTRRIEEVTKIVQHYNAYNKVALTESELAVCCK